MADPPRLTSRLLVDALVRQVQQAGGFAIMLQRGNDQAGTVILECRHRDNDALILEKSSDFDGNAHWRRIAAPNAALANWPDEYRARRVAADPDLWWIELDIADAARFADEILARR
jgi:hypothetical protein